MVGLKFECKFCDFFLMLLNGIIIGRECERCRLRRKKYRVDYNVCVKLVLNYIMIYYGYFEILWNYERFLVFLFLYYVYLWDIWRFNIFFKIDVIDLILYSIFVKG